MQDSITTGPGVPTNTQSSKKMSRRAAASGWLGGALEYYDFFIYAQAAALVFPALFFPADDPTVGVFASLATFGAGYVARPIGAAVLGHYGDRHGRKQVLLVCLFVMGAATTVIALLPTYAQIGWLAPALLVTLRLIQGFAVGGEIAGASVMIVEHAPFGKRGFYGSFATQGVQAGQVLAIAVFLPLSALMPAEAFQTWGWRIPFVLSVLVLLAGYLVRRGVDETPVFQEETEQGAIAKAPLIQVFKESGPNMLRVFFMATMNTVPITVTVFGATYATNKAYGIGFSTTSFLWIALATQLVAMLIIPYLGSLSDKFGRRPLIMAGALTSGVCAFVYLYFISAGNEILAMVSAVVGAGVLYTAYNATYPAFFQELFPAKTRVTGFALPFNIGNAVAAFTPTIFALIAPAGTNVPLVVGSMVFGITALAAIAAYSSPETSRIRLKDLGQKNAIPVSEEEYRKARGSA